MDPSSTSRRTYKPPPNPDIYSTVVVHDESEGIDTEPEQRRRKPNKNSDQNDGPFATMVYKGNDNDGDEDDDPTLPPLFKRLPKDFGGGAIDYFDDEDEHRESEFGTMIVKSDRNRPKNRSVSKRNEEDDSGSQFGTMIVNTDRNRSVNPSSRSDRGDENEDDAGGEGESVSGTMVRKTGSACSGESTMSRVVASMQAVGELGFGKQRKGRPSQGEEQKRLVSKMSTSSIPDSIIREDPTTKYEMLNELGEFLSLLVQCLWSYVMLSLFRFSIF